jgi:PEP-CTERM motif-containing protein
MRWVHALGAAVAATTLVGSTARAVLSVSLVPVHVDPTVASSISSTQTVRSYQLQVTQTGTEKFNVANLQVTLASGNGLSGFLYASPNHNNTTAANPNFTADTEPKDVYDSYVSTPQFDDSPTGGTASTNLSVVGSADWPVGPGSNTPIVPSNATNDTTHNQTMNVVWGDYQASANTTTAKTYTVAQFTIVGNTGAYLRGYFGENVGSSPQFFTPNSASVAGGTLPQGAMYVPLAADDNLDGTVDLTDFQTWFHGLGGQQNTPVLAGDFNEDGVVDLTDFQTWFHSLGNQMPPPPASGAVLGAAVPEPTSLAMLVLGAGALASRRRRA